MATSVSDSPLLVDGHVHFHACFDPDRFLDAAVENFAVASSHMGIATTGVRVLCFSDGRGEPGFAAFRDRAGSAADDPWGFRSTGESVSLEAFREGRPRLFLICGRQIATREGLEVLAIGMDSSVPDGLSIEETMDAVAGAGVPAIIPWGFGKWWSSRGRRVERLIEQADPACFFLGDNGGRPRLGADPRHFEMAGRHGIRVLPGSDPLPFPRHQARAGSYGFRVDHSIDLNRPAQSLLALLRDRSQCPVPFGIGQSLLPFLRNQLAMQWRKRFASATA